MAIRIALFMWLAALSCEACSVPVFRYALEHWEPDDHHLTLPHGSAVRGPFHVTLTDRPIIELRPPGWPGTKPAIWSAAYSEANLRVLLDSPARQEVAGRLLHGHCAVWVMLESDDAARDAAAVDFLTQRLRYLEGVLELPELDQQDIKNGLISVPAADLKVTFSIVKVRRDDPAEAAFVAMLLASEPGLTEVRQPIAFPMFGRGRILYALVGDGIAVETVDRAAQFLTAACSCQIKEQNPGVDVLMNVDWERRLRESTPPGKTAALQRPQTAREPQTVQITASTVPNDVPGDSPWTIVGGVSVLVLLIGCGVLLLRRPSRRG